MPSISGIVAGIQQHGADESDDALRIMEEHLSKSCSPMRVTELLSASEEDRVLRQRRHRAARLLRKAAVASRNKNWVRTFAMVRLALEAAGRDKQVLRDLLKAQNLSFTIVPNRPVAKDRHGLVDPRLTVISETRTRYSFADCR